jgi:hypothetical protein
MQVVLPRKQEEVSNRRTKITKIKITDSCFISQSDLPRPSLRRSGLRKGN